LTVDADILMNLTHNGAEYLVTDEGWFRMRNGHIEEIPAPPNPYELQDTEVKDG
jgi:hypothetical protein